jgi:hypothetical protein
VTDKHFARALQNPVQCDATLSRADSQEIRPDAEKTNYFPHRLVLTGEEARPLSFSEEV